MTTFRFRDRNLYIPAWIVSILADLIVGIELLGYGILFAPIVEFNDTLSSPTIIGQPVG